MFTGSRYFASIFLSIFSVHSQSISFAELEGKVFEGVFVEVSSIDRLSQKPCQADLWVQVFQDSKYVSSQQVFACQTDYERGVRFTDVIDFFIALMGLNLN